VAIAHHSAAVYDMGAVVVLRGTVLHYDWKNPHVYIVIAAEAENGQTAEWAIEGESTALMTRSGWTASTLEPGDRVLARANVNRRPERHEARLVTLTTDAGSVLVRKASGPAPTVAAEGLAGVWDAIRGYDEFRFVRGALTPRGAAIVGGFDEGQSPVKDCLAFPVPIATILPYRTRVQVDDDRILLRSEYFDVERTIYMDGRGHPENGERTLQGHSVGRWEGGALVVDTSSFSDHPLGNWKGLPSGAQKHVVERFELTPDRTQLRVSFRVEDPEYLVEPWIGEIVWDHVPDGEILPYHCDREIARRFAID
ncbi:MAG TPA: DUF6152 family protein, partial [Gammaproteobacteria bacterium]|nr:DUF6152 family protein [Gammaproteobacteria bacterium]